MRCPYCQADDTRVVDSRTVEDGIRRRRECLDCASRFTTYERVEVAAVLVVKRDGRRETFSREKLLAGLRRACEKRPLAADTVDEIAAEVEREVFARASAEVPSTWIGELVMERLKRLDGIAYIRFASVYRHFADVESLREILDELQPARLHAVPEPATVATIVPSSVFRVPSRTRRRVERGARKTEPGSRNPRDVTQAER